MAASTQIAAVLDVTSVGVYGLDGGDVLEPLGGVGALDRAAGCRAATRRPEPACRRRP